MSKSNGWADVAFAAGMIILAGLVFWEAGKSFDPGFDSLGPAFIPQALAIFIALLAAALIALRFRSKNRIAEEEGADEGGDDRKTYGLAGFAFAWTIAYVLAMDYGIIGYTIATFAYVAVFTLAFGSLAARNVVLTVVISAALALGTKFLFTSVFVTGLPT